VHYNSTTIYFCLTTDDEWSDVSSDTDELLPNMEEVDGVEEEEGDEGDVPENVHDLSYDSALYHSDSAATVEIDSDWSINSDSDVTVMLNADTLV
jgi:hypothetical protein